MNMQTTLMHLIGLSINSLIGALIREVIRHFECGRRRATKENEPAVGGDERPHSAEHGGGYGADGCHPSTRVVEVFEAGDRGAEGRRSCMYGVHMHGKTKNIYNLSLQVLSYVILVND